MNVEIGNYKGFAFIINNDSGAVSYEWNGNEYLRFYELCYAINKFLEGGENEH